jgi:hypothetical protein
MSQVGLTHPDAMGARGGKEAVEALRLHDPTREALRKSLDVVEGECVERWRGEVGDG